MTPSTGDGGAAHKGGKAFCVGMFKTGTTTIGAVFENLGYKTFHGPFWDIGNDPFDFDHDDFAANTHRIEALLKNHDAFEDYPFMYVYPWLAEQFPTARFVLTERPAIDVARSDREMWLHGNMDPSEIPPEAAFVERYENHLRGVLDFFGDSDRLIRVKVHEPADHQRLCTFLGSGNDDHGPWPHRNQGNYDLAWPKRKLRGLVRKVSRRRHIVVKPPQAEA